MTDQTKVIFRVDAEGELIAFFPALPGDCNPYRTCLSYQHVGQHGAASLEYYYTTRPARPDEYQELAAELTSIGYALKPVMKMSRADLKARKETVK